MWRTGLFKHDNLKVFVLEWLSVINTSALLTITVEFSSFEPVVTIHCQAALDLGANVEQPFSCLVVQNRQAVQSMRRSMMDWTLEDNMVDGLFFCATLTGRRGVHTPFVQAGTEPSDTGAEAIEPDPGSSWEGHSEGVGASAGDENAESCGGVRPFRIPSVIHPERKHEVDASSVSWAMKWLGTMWFVVGKGTECKSPQTENSGAVLCRCRVPLIPAVCWRVCRDWALHGLWFNFVFKPSRIYFNVVATNQQTHRLKEHEVRLSVTQLLGFFAAQIRNKNRPAIKLDVVNKWFDVHCCQVKHSQWY